MQNELNLFSLEEGCNHYHIQAQIDLDGFMVEWRQYAFNSADYADHRYIAIVRDKNTLEEITRKKYKSDIARYKGLKNLMTSAKLIANYSED